MGFLSSFPNLSKMHIYHVVCLEHTHCFSKAFSKLPQCKVNIKLLRTFWVIHPVKLTIYTYNLMAYEKVYNWIYRHMPHTHWSFFECSIFMIPKFAIVNLRFVFIPCGHLHDTKRLWNVTEIKNKIFNDEYSI